MASPTEEDLYAVARMAGGEADFVFDDDYGSVLGGNDVDDVMGLDNGEGDVSFGDDDFDDEDMDGLIDFDEDDQPANAKVSQKQKVEMIAMRRHLENLDSFTNKKQFSVDKTDEELRRCREKLQQLEEEQNNIRCTIQNEPENQVQKQRLTKALEKLAIEQKAEEALEATILETLDNVQVELAQANVEKGKYSLYREELEFMEEKLTKEKSIEARNRLRTENLLAHNAERQMKRVRTDNIKLRKETNDRKLRAIQSAKENRERAKSFLKDSLYKMKTKAEIENDQSRIEYNQRMNSILELKSDIQDNVENLRAQQLRDHFAGKENTMAMEAEKSRLSADGLNAEAIILTNQRRLTFENEEKAAKAAQRQREVEILSKLVSEEENLEKRVAQQPWVFGIETKPDMKSVKPKRHNVANAILPSSSMRGSGSRSPKPLESMDFTQGERALSSFSTASATSMDDVAAGSGTLEDELDWNPMEDLAKPAFPGMWSGNTAGANRHDREKYNLNYSTKMEKEMMFRALEKQRAGIVQKQVAARREFKGVAYSAKPEIAHFKDLEVGKTYKKKLKLTNVSYSINYIKLLDMSEHLKDFVALEFDSPGQMSAGMTCDLFITFSPMINENLEGTIDFMCQTGPFSVPVKCSVKRCDLSLDVQEVNFGTEVIGQNMRKTVTLINNGGLPTDFTFQRKPLMKRISTAGSYDQDMSSTASVTMKNTAGGKELTTLGKETTMGTLGKESTTLGKESTTLGKEATTLGKETTMGSESKPTSGADPSQHTLTIPDAPAKEASFLTDTVQPLPAGDMSHRDESISRIAMSDRPDEDTSRFQQTVGIGVIHESPLNEEEEFSKVDGMRTGALREGTIGPFQQFKLEILYDPLLPGQSNVEFEISFTDPDSPALFVLAIGRAIDVPVWVERQSVPLEICMYNRLYQDSIIVRNRATIALGLKFEVDKRLKNHLELLPKTAFIQAQSSFSAQLKFLPRESLTEDAEELFDEKTGVLEVPCWITVADQNEPVPFIVTAIVTSSDFHFDKTSVDFGHCSIYENVFTTVHLTNHSILPQPFGFVKIPSFVDIQPNDGFGTLLPEETIAVDLVFSPKKADVYDFEIVCKSGTDRNFKIKCHGIGVHPPLELSHTTVNFSATAVGDQNVAGVFVINSHTSRNEYTHPVPRIGKGEVAPVGPTSFEFCIPEGAPLEMWPVVGTLEPDSKQLVKVLYKPVLSKEEIQKEAIRIAQKKDEGAALLEREEKYKDLLAKLLEDAEKGKTKAKKPAKGSSGGNRDAGSAGEKDDVPPIESIPLRPLREIDPEEVKEGSDNYLSARGSLLRAFDGSFQSFTIPCYVASGALKDPGELEYSVYNTIYLEVHCPAVRPRALVISDCGSAEVNFGKVAIGQSTVKPTTLQNITEDTIEASATPLDPFGPFDLRNALLEIEPSATHTCLFSFTPTEAVVYHETISITVDGESMLLTLKGIGVTPHVAISLENDTLDCGHVLGGDSVPITFTIHNDSDLAVPFLILQDSNALTRHVENQAPPYFLENESLEGLHVGPQNHFGEMVFDCTPWQGLIESGSSQEITVMFSPDHPSQHFADVARISLFSMPYTAVQLTGVGCVHTTYVESRCPLAPAVESLGVSLLAELDEEAAKTTTTQLPIPVLVELQARRNDAANKTLPATASLVVGSVKTSAAAQKKGGEYTFDNIAPLQLKGFNIDQPKGSMESGQQKLVEIVWTPPADHDPNIPMEANIKLMVRGDVSDTYNVMLRALVVSSDEPLPEDSTDAASASPVKSQPQPPVTLPPMEPTPPPAQDIPTPGPLPSTIVPETVPEEQE